VAAINIIPPNAPDPLADADIRLLWLGLPGFSPCRRSTVTRRFDQRHKQMWKTRDFVDHQSWAARRLRQARRKIYWLQYASTAVLGSGRPR